MAEESKSVASSSEEKVAPVEVKAPEPAAKPAKPATPELPKKPTKAELETPVASRAQAIANRIPGVANSQVKMPKGEAPLAERGRQEANKFLAARAKRNV